jgi:hypothetical protein
VARRRLAAVDRPDVRRPGRRYSFGWGSASHKVTGPAVAAAELGRIDAVLLSHDHHGDNLDDAGRALLPSAGVVVTTVPGARRLGGSTRGLRPWESTVLRADGRPNLEIVATPCRHGPRFSRPVVGAVTGFAVRWAAGGDREGPGRGADRGALVDTRRSRHHGGMTHGYETAVDRKIREAQERGEFDHLPGAGRPLPGYGGEYEEDWWVREWTRREGGAAVLPATLALRREVEDLADTLAKARDERAVRAIVAALNVKIDKALRGLLDGPPVVLRPLDPDAVVRRWRTG